MPKARLSCRRGSTAIQKPLRLLPGGAYLARLLLRPTGAARCQLGGDLLGVGILAVRQVVLYVADHVLWRAAFLESTNYLVFVCREAHVLQVLLHRLFFHPSSLSRLCSRVVRLTDFPVPCATA